MADIRLPTDSYIETDKGYLEDDLIESPLPIALDVSGHLDIDS